MGRLQTAPPSDSWSLSLLRWTLGIGALNKLLRRGGRPIRVRWYCVNVASKVYSGSYVPTTNMLRVTQESRDYADSRSSQLDQSGSIQSPALCITMIEPRRWGLRDSLRFFLLFFVLSIDSNVMMNGSW